MSLPEDTRQYHLWGSNSGSLDPEFISQHQCVLNPFHLRHADVALLRLCDIFTRFTKNLPKSTYPLKFFMHFMPLVDL